MRTHNFRKIGDWYFNSKGKLDIDFPEQLSDVPGIIAITVDGVPTFFSSTIHYGPRIKDFKHTKNGETTKARIHHLIEANINKNKKVTTWVKNTDNPKQEKVELINKLNPAWNKQK